MIFIVISIYNFIPSCGCHPYIFICLLVGFLFRSIRLHNNNTEISVKSASHIFSETVAFSRALRNHNVFIEAREQATVSK